MKDLQVDKLRTNLRKVIRASQDSLEAIDTTLKDKESVLHKDYLTIKEAVGVLREAGDKITKDYDIRRLIYAKELQLHPRSVKNKPKYISRKSFEQKFNLK